MLRVRVLGFLPPTPCPSLRVSCLDQPRGADPGVFIVLVCVYRGGLSGFSTVVNLVRPFGVLHFLLSRTHLLSVRVSMGGWGWGPGK